MSEAEYLNQKAKLLTEKKEYKKSVLIATFDLAAEIRLFIILQDWSFGLFFCVRCNVLNRFCYEII